MSKKNLSNKSLCNNYSIDYGAIFEGRCSNSVVSLRESFTIFSKRTHCEAIICVLTKERPSILGVFFFVSPIARFFSRIPQSHSFSPISPRRKKKKLGVLHNFQVVFISHFAPPLPPHSSRFPGFLLPGVITGEGEFLPPLRIPSIITRK